MRLFLLTSALIGYITLHEGKILCQAADKATRPKVGQIYVVGNTVTRSDVILKKLPPGLAPGSALNVADVKLAEQTLRKSGLFKVDAETGSHPTVEILDRFKDEEYKDLLIRVEETNTS